MDTADTRLTGLALSWLLTRGQKPGSQRELDAALRPFVEHRFSPAQCKERFEALREGLLRGKLIAGRGRTGLELTAEGRARALRFLQVEQLPRGLTWKKVKTAHLLARTLDLKPSKEVLAKVSTARGIRAALLKRAHRLEGSEPLTLEQVRDRLLWRQLGVETEQPFTLKAVQAHLLGKLLDSAVPDPRQALEQLAAQAADATRPGVEAVRLAALRQWALPEASAVPEVTPPPRRSEPPAAKDDFAQRVLSVARDLPDGRFGPNKVFISRIWKVLHPEWSSRQAFDTALLEANRTRRLSLSRADLVSAMDSHDIAESEVRAYGASFHFVVV
ncbi:hypothetical protein [Stigmatella aurantiaca]|uniref:Conserved uncharacterized protein n=1 Tax=Stigmatella aurantiaca (strain DW4/3-1) TaxID=378806 RepID=Q097Q3_STIAD|nr:hypothetical protein [Stigmatella aurantiaca]ADO75790.1 conserved uncharacterized protein [Stigmatella aurantiaca DW4/3-1]EAU67963.1 hypothetical protein STIAU_3376 [Stigmatella aurantiaca DW4/3-1]